jgi:hypothetical protein
VGYSHNKEDRDMNEQLQTTVNEMLQKSISAFEQGAEWMAGEVPEVVNQLLMWHLAKYSLISLIAVIAFVFAMVTLRSIFLNKKDDHWAWDSYGLSEAGLVASIAAPLSGLISIVVFLETIFTPIQILIAPKLYILEYAAKLVN